MAKLQRHTPGHQAQLQSYLINHARVFVGSLGRLYQFLGPSIMTVAVIAIALALPIGLYVLLQNAQSLGNSWDGAAKISAYFHISSSNEDQQILLNKFKHHELIDNIEFISTQDSLQIFKERSGFGEVLDSLPSNPLPAVLVIKPTLDAIASDKLSHLKQALSAEPAIDIVQLDLDWVKRLIGIMNIVQRALLVVASMLGVAVILVIGNTIRLDIQNRQREIRVQKMMGATNTFVRRPFLYTGFWYGLFGGTTAWILVVIGLSLLSGPAKRLSNLYQSEFELSYLSFTAGLAVILIGISLGYIGSWIAVGRHLKEIEPG